jgi:hypothetical protein
MPEFSIEFWVATGVAIFTLLVGLAVTLAMDAKTKGEFRSAAGCFIISASIAVYGVMVWQMSITWPSWARVTVAYLSLAFVLVLTGEAIRWAHGRHQHAVAIPTNPQTAQNTETSSKQPSTPPVVTEDGHTETHKVIDTVSVAVTHHEPQDRVTASAHPVAPLEERGMDLCYEMTTWANEKESQAPISLLRDRPMPMSQEAQWLESENRNKFKQLVDAEWDQKFVQRLTAIREEFIARGIRPSIATIEINGGPYLARAIGENLCEMSAALQRQAPRNDIEVTNRRVKREIRNRLIEYEKQGAVLEKQFHTQSPISSIENINAWIEELDNYAESLPEHYKQTYKDYANAPNPGYSHTLPEYRELHVRVFNRLLGVRMIIRMLQD